MSYSYDVLLNFQKDFYDFFEWYEYDEIIHIRKIPLFKASNYDFNVFKNCIVRFDNDFMNLINNRCELFRKINVEHIRHAFLVSNGKETIGIKLNKKGIGYLKSSLLIDESDEISLMTDDLRDFSFNYDIIKTSNRKFQTRFEWENSEKMLQGLNDLFNSSDNDKIKYLYLECYNTNCFNINEAYKKLKNDIECCGENYMKIWNFFKIMKKKA